MNLKAESKQAQAPRTPEGWEVKRLGEVAQIKSGATPSTRNPTFWNGTIPWCTPTDVTSTKGKYLCRTHRNITELGLKSCQASLLPIGSLLLCSRATIGEVRIASTTVTTNQGFKSLICKESVSNQFVYYLLLTLKDHLVERAVGSTFLELQHHQLSTMNVCLPRLDEQEAIAAVLCDIDSLLEGLDHLIAKKRDIKRVAMQQLLTGRTRLPGFNGDWEVKRLGEIAKIIMGQSPSSVHYNMERKGIPLIQGNADISNRRAVPRVFTTSTTKIGQPGDILMSVRAPVGEISALTFEACLGRGVCAIRFPNEFLYHSLSSIESTWIKHSVGSTFDSVNSNEIKAVKVLLPVSGSEQTAIAKVLSDMDAEILAEEARRDKTELLKKAMMQELLTGRTRLVKPETSDG